MDYIRFGGHILIGVSGYPSTYAATLIRQLIELCDQKHMLKLGNESLPIEHITKESPETISVHLPRRIAEAGDLSSRTLYHSPTPRNRETDSKNAVLELRNYVFGPTIGALLSDSPNNSVPGSPIADAKDRVANDQIIERSIHGVLGFFSNSNGSSVNDNEVFYDRDIFMENYKEMNRSLKIYVYPHQQDEPFANVLLPVDFEPGGNYASESYFKKVLMKSHFVTKDPLGADLFFLPFSVARLRHDPRVGVNGIQDFTRSYISNISREYPYWNRSGGNKLAFFSGSNNSPVRERLLQCWGNDSQISVHFGRLDRRAYAEELLASKFCLHVKGFEINTARIGDALYYGCVPVIIANHYDLPFADILNWKSFSIVVATLDIPLLKKILVGISDDRYTKLQSNVMKVRKHFQWQICPVDYDAFYMVMYELWLRRSSVRLQ
nr:probable glycosyltransferase At5g03795 isoform X2 [Ipomoea batatas]